MAETDRPPAASLEALVESGLLRIESLHPGGLELTRDLAERCRIVPGSRVLDVASGTGETARFLESELGARVHGVDRSAPMTHRALSKARRDGLKVRFENASATALPFRAETFDVVLCECTLCFLDKEATLREMMRVVRPGGRVGMHDLCWKDGVKDASKRRLAALEGEEPETLDGWRRLFTRVGLAQVEGIDRSQTKTRWMQQSRTELGLVGLGRLAVEIVRRWGIRGLARILESQRLFASEHLGYGIVVGTRP